MSELIDRGRLIRRMEKMVKDNANYTMTKAYIEWFAELIRNEKQVNAVIPVRCRDCEHYRQYEGSKRCCRPEAFARGAHGIDVRPLDWCSYGKRRSK